LGNFFTDVISLDLRFNSISRVTDLSLLEPITRQLVQQIIEGAKAMGIDVMVYETYRSEARQQALFNQQATQLPKVGAHHYGLACDIVKVVNGEPSWKGDFSFLGQLAYSAGLIWGGDWGNPKVTHSFVDYPHVQRCIIARQSELFAGTWYPNDTYNPYQDEPQPLFARTVVQRSQVSNKPG
jgi:hypothetical protein